MGSRRHCRVTGGSMLPTLKDGDVIIYKPFVINEDVIHPGQIVVINHPLKQKTLIVKRVSKVHSSNIEVLGDNSSISIDSRQLGVINTLQVKGVVEKVIT